MRLASALRSLGPTVLVALGAASAWAQDYTVTQLSRSTSGQWVTPPSTATDFGLTGDDVTQTMTSSLIPFPISYYGRNFTSMSVSTNGFVTFGGGTANGCCSAQAGPFATGNQYDGTCAVAWADDYVVSGALTAVIWVWSDGTAPNRRLIIAWTNMSQCCSYNGTVNFQLQFYETSGRIIMAYTGNWTTGTSYGVGVDEYAGSRYVRPNSGQTSGLFTFVGNPTSDWQFDPTITNFTGTVLYDRYVVDATGIGNTSELNLPASGMTVELRDGANAVTASAVTSAAGAFAIRGVALAGATVGSLVVTGQNPACIVRQISGGAAAGFTLATGVSYAMDRSIGTVVVNEALDPGGGRRAPLNISRTIQGVYDWARARSTDPIAQLEVLYDTTTTLPTSYAVPGALPASMRVAAGATNPDGWDNPVIRRTYSRHVLGSIAAYTTGSMDTSYDKLTSDPNAFAEAFGYYVNTAMTREQVIFDGLGPASSAVIDLETPDGVLLTPRAPGATGWVASALYDLTDASNEAWDSIDGTDTTVDRPFRVVDSLKAPVTAATFYLGWGALGFNGLPLSTNFIHHGLIVDDADEPNDDTATSKVLTQFGFIRNSRILNVYNEDWYEFTMPEPTNTMKVQMVYDRTGNNTQVIVELRDAATGNLIVTATPQGTVGPYVAVTGALSAGKYRIRVRHFSGVRLGDYSLQAFSELAFSSAAFLPWTVGRPYNVPVNVKGGVPPYQLTIEQPFVKPPGLTLDGVNRRVSGVPVTEGLYNFILSARDSANPNNIASGPVSFLVNPELKFHFGDFIAFPAGKDVDRLVSYTGGTSPYVTSVDEGVLPPGVDVTAGATIRFTGMADTPGSYPFKLSSTDVANSSSSTDAMGVVCVPFGTTPLALGEAACGFWFDALEGSAVEVSVKTVAKLPKRELQIAVLDTDGTTELPARISARTGRGSVSGFVAPSTGRFYVIVASAGGDPTQIVADGRITPNRRGSGTNGKGNFVVGKLLNLHVGVLAGARVRFVGRPDDSGLLLRALHAIDPAGNIVFFEAGEVVEKGKDLLISKTLNATGTWQLVIGAKPGFQGHFKYSYNIDQPGGRYSAD